MILEGKTGKWEIVIGLEVHAQVVSNAKLFSGSSAVEARPRMSRMSFDARRRASWSQRAKAL